MGGKFKKKKNVNKVVQKSRKQLRKEQRKNKKARKDEYFRNKGNQFKTTFTNQQHSKNVNSKNNFKFNEGNGKIENASKEIVAHKEENHIQKQVKKLKEEKQSMNKLEKKMKLTRNKQLMEANEVEDKAIKKLEKLLKLYKRKNKSLPKTFVDEGLDYLLDVCDSERIQGAVKVEMNLQESGSEFEEDFALVTGNETFKKKKKNSKTENKKQKQLSDSDDEIHSSFESGGEGKVGEENKTERRKLSNNNKSESQDIESDGESDVDSQQDFGRDNSDDDSEYFSNDFDDDDDDDTEDGNNDSFGDQIVAEEENDKEKNISVNRKSKNLLQRERKGREDDRLEYSEDNDSFSSDESVEDVSVKNNNKAAGTKAVTQKKKHLLNQQSNNDNKNSIKNNLDKNMEKQSVKRKINSTVKESTATKKKKTGVNKLVDDETASEGGFGSEDESYSGDENVNDDDSKGEEQQEKDEFWEDIYGRTRDKKGNVVQTQSSGKYVPPQLRAQQMSGDAKRTEVLARLKKQLKGFVNRLAENNVHSIANQIDELYMKNSRNDMNETLTQVLFDSMIAPVLTPERLIMEHVMLIAILHANVGTEVGAHFLQSVAKKYDEMSQSQQDVEDKQIDNVVLILSHLYNFSVCHSVLVYDILNRLSDVFREKEVELILIVLRSVGFTLRKDDPLALKELILRLQKKANEASSLQSNSRVRFMLDILLAVKNNNMAKMPQYDPSHSEHLKKRMKTMVRKGKYVTELKITLEDLLKAEERGRWWIVGSAWTGDAVQPSTNNQASIPVTTGNDFSKAVLELARKQRMNTDTRRNVFCILMTAEDYLDAFEKLLRLGLKAQQEQEIVHVLIHCLLQEKDYNPYYAHVANQLCRSNRKHQMTIQYHLWDKLKELTNLSPSQITNLAKFLAYLFLETALPISVLKVMQFSEMDKSCVRLLRQILLSILLHDSEETMAAVFSRVARSGKLHMFRESLRLFMHHFVLKNAKESSKDMVNLLKRAKLAESALTSVDINKFLS